VAFIVLSYGYEFFRDMIQGRTGVVGADRRIERINDFSTNTSAQVVTALGVPGVAWQSATDAAYSTPQR
jgi:S-adenosylhomocysteine hydrolase